MGKSDTSRVMEARDVKHSWITEIRAHKGRSHPSVLYNGRPPLIVLASSALEKWSTTPGPSKPCFSCWKPASYVFCPSLDHILLLLSLLGCSDPPAMNSVLPQTAQAPQPTPRALESFSFITPSVCNYLFNGSHTWRSQRQREYLTLTHSFDTGAQ